MLLIMVSVTILRVFTLLFYEIFLVSVRKKRVAITQRIVNVQGKGECRDALDQAWTDFLADFGWDLLPIPNRLSDPVAYLKDFDIAAIILSGGGNISTDWKTRSGMPPEVLSNLRDIAPERDILESRLLCASAEQGWPVIGVCRGMQFINLFHGGCLEKIDFHAGAQHEISIPDRNGHGIEFDQTVNSYHDFGIPLDGIADGFQVLAVADGYAEAIVNRSTLQLGIMWHPERNQPWSRRDVSLFSQFLATGELCESSKKFS